jgi:indole-3-glycerol phosphate synthase
MADPNILATIVAQKRLEVARLPEAKPNLEDLRQAMQQRGGARDFLGALQRPIRGNMALIAEVKKASPSKGVICANFDPVRIARDYERGGASCLSVLTDERFFQGSLEYLASIRKAVTLPLLRKDFIIDARQILEAIQYGADAILLIVAILSDEQLREFHGLATGAGLAALVEVHDEAEMDRAVAAGATLIGVNNRDLKTFRVDLATTERLANRLGAEQLRDRLLVAESGIFERQDVARLAACGARAILVGESLVKEQNIPGKVAELMG